MRHRSHAFWSVLQIGFVLLVSSLVGNTATAENPRSSIPLPMALHKFAMYTTWPDKSFKDEKAPFVFGILGQDPFGKDTELLKGATLMGRKLVIKRLANLQEALSSHLLFISSSEKERLPQILEALKNTSILTVGDMENFYESRGMLQIVSRAEGTSFKINEQAVKDAKLSINPQLIMSCRNPGK